MMNRTTLRGAMAAVAALLSVTAIAPAEEAVFLNSGEQYQIDVREIDGVTLKGADKDAERDFPLENVQRIEFQKAREFDGVDTPEALSAASTVFANALAADTEELRKQFPQAGYVVLSDDLVVMLKTDGSYSAERTRAWRILDQRSADSSFQSIYFFPDREKVSVDFGITVGPDGSVSRVSDGTMKTEAVYPQFPEYNYEQRLRLAMKSPQPGATLFLKTTKSGKATTMLPLVVDQPFWDSEPALERSVTLVADDQTRRNVAVYTSGGLLADDSGGTWKVTATPQVFSEPMMPPTTEFAPRLVIAFPKAQWKDLAGEFASRVDASPVTAPGVTTPRKAYDRVRKAIRGVGVPQSAVPVPPVGPAEVLRKGYGTGMEKALLLEALLKGLGRDASVVLVRGRGAGSLAESAPRINAFNYALVRLAEPDGSETWLEPTAVRRAYGEVSESAQGAPGLDIRSGMLVEVPVKPAEDEGTRRDVKVTLAADGSAVVDDTMRMRGGQAISARQLGDMSAEELRKWAESFVAGELPGVELINFSHSDFEALNSEESITFTYRIPDLARASGNFLVMRLPNADYTPSEVGRDQRRYDLFWLGRDFSETTFTVLAPEGYRPYALSPALSESSQGWRLSSVYSEGSDYPGSVVFKETWRREALSAAKDSYEAYRVALIHRGILRNEMIVFEKPR